MGVALVLLAGGAGTRAKSPIPKQFVDVLGDPLIVHTLRKFVNHPAIDHVCIVCNPDYIDLMKNVCEKYGMGVVKQIVPGGKTGLESTYIGIRSIPEEYDCVMIHDANRPIIDDEIIDDCIDKYHLHGNAVAAIPSVDLTYRSDDGLSSDCYLNRDMVWKTHTPQAYNLDEARGAYDAAFSNGDPGFASTTELYVSQGKRIYFSLSKSDNIKITFPEDFVLLKALILAGHEV